MKIVIHENEGLPMTANPRFWDRLLAVCSVMLLMTLAGAVWLKVNDRGPGAYSGKPIQIEIRAPEERAAVVNPPTSTEVAVAAPR
ncbi:hypothetical protein GC173_09765 [bacterium]|nr:hypothetical protein [bacterium]